MLNNATIQQANAGFLLNSEFLGIEYDLKQSTPEIAILYPVSVEEMTVQIDLSTVKILDSLGADVTPLTTNQRAELISIFVSKRGVTSSGGSDVTIVDSGDIAKETTLQEVLNRLDSSINVITGKYETNTGAWGEPIFSQKKSLGRGLFTFEIGGNFKKLLNDTEQLNGALATKIFSDKGKGVVTTSVLGEKITNRTQSYFQYQPDRGQIYSDSEWLPNAGSGRLYFVIRKMISDTVEEERIEITEKLPNDISKGNLYDIQFQWRGAGDYNAFVNLEKSYVKNNLGTTVELTLTNPSLPVAFEVVKGGSTYGGVVRANSVARWGLFSKDNGVYFEYEYEDDRDPRLECGCWDVSSEGGTDDTITYAPVTAIEVASDSGERPTMAVRIPNSKDVNGNIWEFTRSALFKQLIVGQNDESRVRVYYTRDDTAVVDTGTVGWQFEVLTNTIQYLINDDSDGNHSFTFDSAKAVEVFGVRVEQDQPQQFKSPLAPDGNIQINPGDYLIITHQTNGTDLVDVTAQFGVKP